MPVGRAGWGGGGGGGGEGGRAGVCERLAWWEGGGSWICNIMM